ncbi:MAG: tail fiber protein [Pseudomonadota bacterium]
MKFWKRAVVGVLMSQSVVSSAQAQDFYLGQVLTVGFNFCPRGTAEAAGQLLPISQNSALFSLLGTFYGGDGRTTFALPDLRGGVIAGSGKGAGLRQEYPQGLRATTSVRSGDELGVIAMKHCIVTEGIFPSRG